jgi:MAE_28990/MAE_18760-like HEPN
MEFSNEIQRLISEIEKERDWRVKEFQNIKILNFKIETLEKCQSTFSTMCIPIIYAHWEGFCSSTFRLVIDYINNKTLSYDQLNNCLFTYSNKKTYDYLKGKQSFSQRCKFSKSFIKSINESNIKLDGKLETKSNLKFDVLIEMLKVFDIVEHNLEGHRSHLNRLVEIRNNIVHGENSINVTSPMTFKTIENVVTLIDDLILLLANYLENEKYLNPS